MKVQNVKYIILNIAVLLLTTILFIGQYGNVGELFAGVELLHIGVLLLTVILVHAMKAGRLYLALYGTGIDLLTCLRIYCKITPVSVVIPFKLGEFFRIYCYGKQLGSLLKGAIVILLDRFMDTFALVTMILFIWVFGGGEVGGLVYGFLIFLALVLLVYFSFPGVYQFWKKYILRADASEHRLAVLKMLDGLHMIHREITGVSIGRGMLLYCLSLLAWGLEIGSIALLVGVSKKGGLVQSVSDYLLSAMGGKESPELLQFVFASVILMLLLYLFIKVKELLEKKRMNK